MTDDEQQLPISYLLLKPDGNRPEVIDHVKHIFRSGGISFSGPFQVRFSFEQALDFYPKSAEWKQKYGQKRIDFLCNRGRMKRSDAPCALYAGDQILNAMAEYLSSGNCALFLFESENAVWFGREIAGATVPADAHSSSLRGMFSKDTLEAAAIEERALHNVVHAPEAEDLVEELQKIVRLDFADKEERGNFLQVVLHTIPQVSQ